MQTRRVGPRPRRKEPPSAPRTKRPPRDKGRPPSALHRYLSLAFGGASVRREREPRYEVFSVRRMLPNEYRLELAHDLMEDTDDDALVALIERHGLVERMRRHAGRAVRVKVSDRPRRVSVDVERRR